MFVKPVFGVHPTGILAYLPAKKPDGPNKSEPNKFVPAVNVEEVH